MVQHNSALTFKKWMQFPSWIPIPCLRSGEVGDTRYIFPPLIWPSDTGRSPTPKSQEKAAPSIYPWAYSSLKPCPLGCMGLLLHSSGYLKKCYDYPDSMQSLILMILSFVVKPGTTTWNTSHQSYRCSRKLDWKWTPLNVDWPTSELPGIYCGWGIVTPFGGKD